VRGKSLVGDGTDGNAFAVLGRVRRALQEVGVDEAEVSQFSAKATSGDCGKLLQTATRWVDVA
jgi:hypothetical protein